MSGLYRMIRVYFGVTVHSLQGIISYVYSCKEDCAYFKRGKCKYPDKVCWKKHTQNVHINSSTHAVVTERNTPPPDVECYICKK